jgi:hypothetical protein
MHTITPVSINHIPYELLNDYTWIDDYFASLELRERIVGLREARRRIKKQALAKADVIENLKNYFEQYQKARVKRLADRISAGRRNGNPFASIDLALLKPRIEWEEVEEALSLVHDDNTISEKARLAELTKIEKQIAELKTDLSAVSPSKFYTICNARVMTDCRDDFINHWHNIQARVNLPCGPTGVTLDASSDSEKKAYERLGIAKAINFNAFTAPHPGTKYMA